MFQRENFKPLYKVVNDDGIEFQFDGQVCVSNQGTLFVNPRKVGKKNMNGYFTKGRPIKTGHRQVALHDANGKRGWFYIHTLMGWAWLDKHPLQNVVMHLDDDPHNNTLSNIRWGTQKDNWDDMMSKGRNPKWGSVRIFSDELAFEIFNKRLNGVPMNDIKLQYPHINRKSLYHLSSGHILKQRGLIEHTITQKDVKINLDN